MRETNRFTTPDQARYGVDVDDVAGQMRGVPYRPPVRSGATPERPQPDPALGTFESVAVRTRKGRSSFKVTRRHARFVVGLDPIRETLEASEDGGMTLVTRGVRLTGSTLADLADAWVREFRPYAMSEAHGGRRVCTCDDLTHAVLTLDRENGFRPVYDAETGQYVTVEATVRSCHCGFPRLMGTDLGLSWEEVTPTNLDAMARGGAMFPRPAYVGRNRARENARRRVRTTHLSRAHGVPARIPSVALPTDVISARLAATDAPVVTITDFPGVRIVVRRPASGGAMSVRVTGARTETFRARTVARIARAIDV